MFTQLSSAREDDRSVSDLLTKTEQGLVDLISEIDELTQERAQLEFEPVPEGGEIPDRGNALDFSSSLTTYVAERGLRVRSFSSSEGFKAVGGKEGMKVDKSKEGYQVSVFARGVSGSPETWTIQFDGDGRLRSVNRKPAFMIRIE